MKVFTSSGIEHNLTTANFIASGGAGSVYKSGNFAVKIYHEPKNCISEAHLTDLKRLNRPNIVSPKEFVYDAKKNRLGYVMPLVKAKYTLEELFPKTFKDRHSLTLDAVLKLVRSLKDGISYCHTQDVTLVDINPLNFLVDEKFGDVFFLDADSYQTKTNPATFINPRIQDYSSKTFTPLTDWYSYAIVTFQLITGIHPFGGKYTGNLGVDKTQEIFERMRKNISVFNKDVNFPAFVNLSSIPQAYADWYKSLFVEGKRTLPPNDFTQAITAVTATVSSIVNLNAAFEYKKLYEFEDLLYTVNDYYVTKSGVFDNFSRKVFNHSAKWESTITLVNNQPFYIEKTPDSVDIFNMATGSKVNFASKVESFTVYNNDVYLKQGLTINKLDIIGANAGLRQVAQCTALSTTAYDGCFIQNILGKLYLSVFDGGKHYQTLLNFSNSDKVIDAKYVNGLVVILFQKKDGLRYKLIGKLNKECKFDFQEFQDSANINFAALSTGVYFLEFENDYMLFKDLSAIKKVAKGSNDSYNQNFTLTQQYEKVIMLFGNEIYQVSMKK